MKTVLHSISYAGLWRNQAFLPLKDFLVKAATLGYDAVEITCKRPHAGVLDLTTAIRKEIRDIIKENKLECAAMAAYTNFSAGAGSAFIPINEMQLIYINEIIKLADEWDCRLIRIFTGYEEKNMSYFSQWEMCVKAIRECCRLAGPYGIKIGIQNHHDIALDAETLAVFINEVGEPNCVAMYDPWSLDVQGLNPLTNIEKIYPKMVYTTLADYKPLLRSHHRPGFGYERDMPVMRACAMGDGIIDNAGFLDGIFKLGYDGYVAYEMCADLEGGGHLENLDYCAKRFLDFRQIKEKLK